jgi:hypothetical protein
MTQDLKKKLTIGPRAFLAKNCIRGAIDVKNLLANKPDVRSGQELTSEYLPKIGAVRYQWVITNVFIALIRANKLTCMSYPGKYYSTLAHVCQEEKPCA